MKPSTTTAWSNLKVGLLLMIAIAAMLWASLTGGGTSIFDPKGKFVCYFKNVGGLVNGSPVWMSGVEVGNVRSVKFVNLDSLRQVEVVCRVKKSVWPMLTTDAKVQLSTIGFLGDKYVEIIPGVPSAIFGEVIDEMDIVPTIDVGSAEAMFKTGEETLESTGDLARSLDAILARMNRGEGTFGQMATNDELYHRMTKLLVNLTKLSAALHENQERITVSIESTAGAISDLTQQVDSNTGTLGRIIADPALYDNLVATSARLDTIMSRINAAEGTLGLFVNDTALYAETVNLMVRVRNLVDDIEQNPRKYFKFSVF